jgi:hypothetical protein
MLLNIIIIIVLLLLLIILMTPSSLVLILITNICNLLEKLGIKEKISFPITILLYIGMIFFIVVSIFNKSK